MSIVMISRWQQFASRPIVWVNLLVSLVFHIAAWGILLMHIRPNDEYIILHYSLALGVDRVGPWYHSFAIPVLGFSFLFIHVALAHYLFSRAQTVAIFLLLLMPFLQFLLFLAAVFVVIANLPVRI